MLSGGNPPRYKTNHSPGYVFTGVLRPSIAFPVVTCYHSHRSIPRRRVGVEDGWSSFPGKPLAFVVPIILKDA
jgi:hypothetical protein